MYSRLIGNERAKSQLLSLHRKGRVPNALLFVGPERVGKKLFAFEFSRSLLCRTGTDGEACGTCSICTRISPPELPREEKGEDFDRVFLTGHPDVGLVVPYKRNLRVGAIRELEREAHFRAFEGERRVFIVNDAEKMNDSSANALLKTLEEPPPSTYLILISSRPDALLKTILSRCQMIRFSPVSIDDIESHLVKDLKIDAADAKLAAGVSAGSVGKAINLDVEQFRSSREMMLQLLRSAAIDEDLTSMLQMSAALNDAKNKERFESNIHILQSLLRDVFALNIDRTAKIENADITADLASIVASVDREKLAVWATDIEELLANLNVNINRKVATDGLFAKMTA